MRACVFGLACVLAVSLLGHRTLAEAEQGSDSLATQMVSASTERDAWFVGPGPLDEPALFHVRLPLGDEAAARVALPLRSEPLLGVAGGDRVLLVFPPTGDGFGRRVRQTGVIEYRPGLLGYEPPSALGPLPGTGRPAMAFAGDTPLAFAGDALRVADGSGWMPLELPEGVEAGGQGVRFVLHGLGPGRFRLVRVHDDGRLVMWEAELSRSVEQVADGAADETGADAGSGAVGRSDDAGRAAVVRAAWSEASTARWGVGDEAAERVEVVAAGDALFAVVWHEEASDRAGAVVRRLRSDGPVEVGGFPSVPIDAGLSASGDGVLFAWPADERAADRADAEDASAQPDQGRVILARALLVGPSGSVRFEGPVLAEAPLGQKQLQAVVLLLMSIMLTVMLYVARRDAGDRGAVTLPDGFVIAEPSRRLFAGLIDGMLAYVGIGIAYGDPLRWLTENVVVLLSEEGAAPIVLWATVLAAHTAATESVFATTIGKRLAGLRTVTSSGAKPPVSTAITRSLARAMCPFAAVLLIMEPHRPHPASLGTFSVMKRRDREPGGGDANGSADDR